MVIKRKNFFDRMHIYKGNDEMTDDNIIPEIIVLVGPPGSAKSTLAKEYKQHVYINQDTQQKEHLEIFKRAIEQKHDIIVDRMGFNVEQRKRYLEPAKKVGYKTRIIVLHQNKETCLKRCAARNDHPTIKNEQDAGRAVNMFFSKYERVEDSEADVVERIWPKELYGTLQLDALVCDIDNTLSNTSHREHHLQGPKKNWKAFFDNMHNDTLNKWCAKIVNTMRQNNIIVICSGRPDTYRDITKKWLEDNKIQYDWLFMRPRDDSREDSIVKEIILEWEILTRFQPLFYIDDRLQVINKIRQHGIVVLDCKGNTF